MDTKSLAPFLFVLAAAVACQSSSEPQRAVRDDGASARAQSPEQRGEDLYAQHCSVCHGTRGHGDGAAAPFLFPPARRFDSGRFRLVSSENGAPFAGDIVATLRRGIPGSAMPAWSWLPDGDLSALAAHVRVLAVEGLARDLERQAREAHDAHSAGSAQELARARLTPDRAIAAAAPAPADAATAERGRRVYRERCAQCHAADGTGERTPRYDEDGTLNWARDFTAGFLKGGDSTPALTCRIRAGIPGSAMPPNRLEAADESALVAYVQSLIPKGVAQRLVHTRSRLEARRVRTLPVESDDPAWDAAPAIRVVLAPLWWNDEAVLEARLAALHDGKSVALRLSWADSTGEVRLFGDSRASDGAALQFSDAEQPALFGMGAPHEATNLWHWQALRLEDVAGALDLVAPVPHAGVPPGAGDVRTDVPVYRRLLGRMEPSDRADRITVRGLDSLRGSAAVAGEVRANAHWEHARWNVVFERALMPEGASANGRIVPLAPGSTVQVACAVWNGAAGDAGARKSISIWQELRIER